MGFEITGTELLIMAFADKLKPERRLMLLPEWVCPEFGI